MVKELLGDVRLDIQIVRMGPQCLSEVVQGEFLDGQQGGSPLPFSRVNSRASARQSALSVMWTPFSLPAITYTSSSPSNALNSRLTAGTSGPRFAVLFRDEPLTLFEIDMLPLGL